MHNSLRDSNRSHSPNDSLVRLLIDSGRVLVVILLPLLVLGRSCERVSIDERVKYFKRLQTEENRT